MYIYNTHPNPLIRMECISQATREDILQAKKDLIGTLIVKNNETNSEDLGIIQMIEAMESIEPAKTIKSNKSVKKEHLIVSLGFFNHLPFADAKKRYQGTKMDDLAEAIISKFNRLLPDLW